MPIHQKAVQILGNYAEFYAMQIERLLGLGIDVRGLEVSHLAFRIETLEEYLVVRGQLEELCKGRRKLGF